MKVNVLIDYSQQSDSEFLVAMDNIISKLTGNTNFPNPIPSLVELQNGRNDFSTALIDSVDGGKSTTQLKKQKREAAELTLRSLGQYIQANCQNDPNIVLSTGFHVKKASSPIGILPKPENFKVAPGPNTGSIKLMVDAIDGADVYIYQYTIAPLTPDTRWEKVVDGKRSILIHNLTAGKEYAFRVAAKGAADELVQSDTITQFVA